MVYQINHDEVEMNNVPLITVEPVAELLRANGEMLSSLSYLYLPSNFRVAWCS